ncbi:MAG TPA: hypothetical protein VFE92_13690 [Dermatophilaceae bacterium]|nr:hypothetical protein [Dermatophilaceae bacterium]
MDTLPARTAGHPHAGRWAGLRRGRWGIGGHWAGRWARMGWAAPGALGGLGGTGLGAVPMPEPVA